MSGGKGGSTTTSGSNYSTGTSTTDLPDWVTSASQSALAQGQALAAQPYTPYLGQLVASTSPYTQQAYQAVENMQGQTQPYDQASLNTYLGLLGQAAPITSSGLTGNTNALYGNYTGSVLDPATQAYSQAYGNAASGLGGAYANTASLLSPYMQQGPATAQQVGSNAMQLMQPYEAAVTDPALRLGAQALAQNLQQIGAGANQVGAFGGSRQGVMEGVAQSQAALGSEQYIGNMLAQGYNAALSPAYNLASLASQQGFQGAQMLGQQGYNTAQTLGGYGEQNAGALSQLAASGYGSAASQAYNQAVANQNAGLTAAQQLPSTASQMQSQAQNQASLLQTIGTAQQQQQQNELNAQYGQFEIAQAYPYQQLDTLLSTLGAIPYGSTTNYQGYNMGNQTSRNDPSIGSSISQGAGTASSLIGLLSLV